MVDGRTLRVVVLRCWAGYPIILVTSSFTLASLYSTAHAKALNFDVSRFIEVISVVNVEIHPEPLLTRSLVECRAAAGASD